MIPDNELREILTDEIVNTLAVEPDEVTPEARLFADLGAESIDVLDLSFRLEKRLGIKVQLGEAVSDEAIRPGPDGKLSPQAVAEMQKRFPNVPPELADSPVTIDDLKNLLTVDAILLLLKDKLAPAGT